MTGLDLTPAVEAAARANWDRHAASDHYRPDGDPWSTPAWDELTEEQRADLRESMRPVVEAVAPLIEAAFRERVAEEIEGATSTMRTCLGLEMAARIVRGDR